MALSIRPPKAKGALDSVLIQRQTPGQSSDDIINLLPGVSSQNNNPFGSAGGTLSIRGFDFRRRRRARSDQIVARRAAHQGRHSLDRLAPDALPTEQAHLSPRERR
ncbi:hypothetical protein [Sphingomonas sp.]|uniref:hypothetical protein n=1 Tax=Sphingomonas sp. TaxID=28214 RepID=UPI003B00B217